MSFTSEQLSEIELINSMYPGQVVIDDPNLESSFMDFSSDQLMEKRDDGQADHHLSSAEFTFNLIDNQMEIFFSLPPKYPLGDQLFAYCRLLNPQLTNSVAKRKQILINSKIKDYIQTNSDVNVLNVIQFLQELYINPFDNDSLNPVDVSGGGGGGGTERVAAVDEVDEVEEAEDGRRVSSFTKQGGETLSSSFLSPSSSASPSQLPTESRAGLSRIWIYSHHIYSKIKRKEILERASDLNLNGFCRPGKPGFITVEGSTEDCNRFWQGIRCFNWQKITVIEQEDNLNSLLFTEFTELIMDNSAFIKHLEEKDCSEIIKGYLGFS